jgi:hypothetical protein
MSSQDPTVVTGTASLRYPLTVLSIDAPFGADVHKHQPVFTFQFTGTAVESQDDGTDKDVPRIFVESFDSPIDGRELQWFIQSGDIIRAPRCDAYTVSMSSANHPEISSFHLSNHVYTRSSIMACAQIAARTSPGATFLA